MTTERTLFFCRECKQSIFLGVPVPYSEPQILLQCLKQNGVGCGWEGFVNVAEGIPQE
jgi:hypothetical protein